MNPSWKSRAVGAFAAAACLSIAGVSFACGGEDDEQPKDGTPHPSVLCGGEDGERPKDGSPNPSVLCGGEDEEQPKDGTPHPS